MKLYIVLAYKNISCSVHFHQWTTKISRQKKNSIWISIPWANKKINHFKDFSHPCGFRNYNHNFRIYFYTVSSVLEIFCARYPISMYIFLAVLMLLNNRAIFLEIHSWFNSLLFWINLTVLVIQFPRSKGKFNKAIQQNVEQLMDIQSALKAFEEVLLFDWTTWSRFFIKGSMLTWRRPEVVCGHVWRWHSHMLIFWDIIVSLTFNISCK